VCENPVDDLPNQEKNQYCGLFIDRTAALYIGETRIRFVTNENSGTS